VFEDVHWADQATIDLLRYLGRRLDRLHALVVATVRDDEVTARGPVALLLGDLATAGGGGRPPGPPPPPAPPPPPRPRRGARPPPPPPRSWSPAAGWTRTRSTRGPRATPSSSARW